MMERPINIKSHEVRAILEGRRTQTRQVVKPQLVEHVHIDTFGREVKMWSIPKPKSMGGGVIAGQLPALAELCPYGQPGDRLWVRETWGYDWFDDGNLRSWKNVVYRADDDKFPSDNGARCPWKPSIHMPRMASRITLEIVAVRVEWLREITRGDCMAEGCPFPNMAEGRDPRSWFADLWTDINGIASGNGNPWVWVIDFKRVEG